MARPLSRRVMARPLPKSRFSTFSTTSTTVLNRAALIIKVGDKPNVLDRQYATTKHNMPISLIMERDWGKTLEEIISPETRTVFRVVEVNPLLESFYMNILQPLNPDQALDARWHRSKKCILPLETLATKLNRPDLADADKRYEETPLIDGRSLNTNDFLDALAFTTPYNVVEDRLTINGGDYNIGSGETYTTLSAFAADIAVLVAKLKGTITSDITETSVANFDHPLNGFETELTSDAESYGYPNVGHIVTVNHNLQGIIINIPSGTPATFHFHKFYLKSSASAGTSSSLIQLFATISHDVLIHDVMLDCNGSKHGYGLQTSATDLTVKAFNIIAWDANYSNCKFTLANSNSIVENITGYNSGGDGISFNAQVLSARNLLSFGNSGVDLQYTYNLTQFDKCASEDNSGSEVGLQNLTPANIVNSLDDTNSEFMNITPGSAIDGAGTTSILIENIEGIRNNTRPNGSSEVSCGATEVGLMGLRKKSYLRGYLTGNRRGMV